MGRENSNHGRGRTTEQGSDGLTSRRNVLRLAGIAGTGALAGCIGGAGLGGGQNIDTVTYGVLSPMTGPYGGLAEGQRNGAKLAVRHVNESDQFSFEMEAVYEDTEADTATGRQVAQKVVQQDDAQFLMGAISSSTALALNSFAANEEVVYNPGAAAMNITGAKCNEWVFRAETHTAQIAEAVAPWTANNVGTNVWFHIADYAYGQSVRREWKSRMSEASDDFTEVGVSRSQLGASNYGSYVSQISNSEADVAVLGMTGGDLINFTKQAANSGLKQDVELVSPTMTFQVVRNALGPAAYGTYGGVRYNAQVETGDNQEFVSAYRDAYGSTPDSFARVAYDSIRMTAHGIEEAGTNDPEAVKDTLPGLEVPSVFGPNKFRKCDHQATNPVWAGENVKPDSGDAARVALRKKVEGKNAIPPCGQTNCDL
ncbi:ABC transporter substrate-binding protein [Halorussus sp. MSC15.2]|uniref:ABC transporter substrate-binding protein n=1 Tax=Halorussus sp. MSC15.2 TaxID=2283638 RepID=UPI0013D3A92F|nr:ABC transporter substrate-binding protein [Halorussus sp. MSC15.2]NEU58334.1 ABC transporter substrate-binding protein [Halorussus sp. MSC15.2]